MGTVAYPVPIVITYIKRLEGILLRREKQSRARQLTRSLGCHPPSQPQTGQSQ